MNQKRNAEKQQQNTEEDQKCVSDAFCFLRFLSKPYSAEKAKLIVREMTDQLVLDMVRKRVVADQIVLNIGYDHTGIPEDYSGKLVLNYGGHRA